MSDDEVAKGPISESQAYELKDLFGESSDEDEVRGRGHGGDDDDFGSDSDDGSRAGKKSAGSRLVKGGSSKAKKGEKGMTDKDRRKAERKAEKASKKEKKKGKKRSRNESEDNSRQKRSKKDAPKTADFSKYADDGDAYDSDGDVEANADDDNFIADEDGAELAGVVGEYNADVQDFHDERPDAANYSSKSKGKKGGGGSSTRVSTKASDVFSQTLAGMKKAKVQELTETDKQRVATEFLKTMSAASIKDDAAYERKQPAVYKLNLLKKVQDMVGVRAMQNTLLDFDILGVLSDWIAPKADNTLPSHTIRTAVYQMLSLLPAQSDHLKRKSDDTGRTIGMTVMALFRHKQETRENKLVLKALIEKWSRPIFRKQADARSADLGGNAELQQVVSDQIMMRAAQQEASVSFEEAIQKRGNSDAYSDSRASCPYSAGFLYTVRPESKATINYETLTANDEGRKAMLKKMNDMKNANRSGVGKKENTTTMDMERTGRNKA